MELKGEAPEGRISQVGKIKNPMSSRGESRTFSFPPHFGGRGTE
jgi:hypothetical protein